MLESIKHLAYAPSTSQRRINYIMVFDEMSNWKHPHLFLSGGSKCDCAVQLRNEWGCFHLLTSSPRRVSRVGSAENGGFKIRVLECQALRAVFKTFLASIFHSEKSGSAQVQLGFSLGSAPGWPILKILRNLKILDTSIY